MGRDDWYRNTDWTPAIEAAFRAKLKRSRTMRPQYLQIQAGQIASSHPEVALALIDEYFETGDDFVVPSALCTKAEAMLALGKVQEALDAYRQALAWEDAHPNFITTARIDLPKLVAEQRIESEYDFALDILTTRFKASDHQFPSMRYYWNGSCALITHERGEVAEAKEFADRALRAAAQTESPFRYHRSVGIVKDASDEFGTRIKRIAKPSKLRSLFRLI
ncbi:MAG: hypothetical protein MT490_09910 [Sphingomonas sp.]|uniref:hypothetical protein n=1 Tax=Sphingomonas sp. TaxID=28214 RepID=UPI0022748C9C|nr:hypothetical protein [Sphingomonas sp.]MCX8476099.1 hypothetical protein [Sphingomonas sp.]